MVAAVPAAAACVGRERHTQDSVYPIKNRIAPGLLRILPVPSQISP